MLTPQLTVILVGSGILLLLSLIWLWWTMRWPTRQIRAAYNAWREGDHETAHGLAEALLGPLKERTRFRDLATVRLLLAAYYWEKDSPRQMAEHARRALDESLVKGRSWQQLLADVAFGLALVEMGRWEEARKPLESAELQSTARQEPRVRMFIRTGLGWVHLGMGGRQLATDYARAACSEVANHPNWAFEHPYLCLSLGQLCFELGLWEEALARLDEAQLMTQKTGQPALRCQALLLHGRIDLERGDFERADQLLQEALQIAGNAMPELRGRLHLQLARLHQWTGQPNEARLALEQARAAAAKAEDNDLSWQVALAMAGQHRQQKRHADTRELLLKTQVNLLSAEPGVALAQTLVAWGELFLEQGNNREAYAHFRLADRFFQNTGKTVWDIDLPYRLALLHHRMGLMDQGMRYEKEGDALRRRLGVRRQPAVLRPAGE